MAAAPLKPLFTHGSREEAADRPLAEEMAVAMSYGGSTHAVMMASPADLEDLAVGFSLNEVIVEHPGQIEEIRVAVLEDGIDLRIRLDADRAAGLRFSVESVFAADAFAFHAAPHRAPGG